MSDITPEAPGSAGTSRRSLLAAAAWTAPVVALAGATPARAASTAEPTGEIMLVPGDLVDVRLPRWSVPITIVNDTAKPILSSVSPQGPSTPGWQPPVFFWVAHPDVGISLFERGQFDFMVRRLAPGETFSFDLFVDFALSAMYQSSFHFDLFLWASPGGDADSRTVTRGYDVVVPSNWNAQWW